MSNGSRRAAAVLSLAVLLSTGVYGASFWAFRDRGPKATAIEEAARLVRARHTPGDLVFLVPFYATRAREYLGDLGVLAVRDPLGEDLPAHPRAWVLGLFGEGVALRARMQAAGLELLDASEPAAGVTVDLYGIRTREATTYDFRAHFREARVFHEKGGERTACAVFSETNAQGGALGGRWSCPRDAEWFYVAPEWHRMGEHTRVCFWAHPPNEGRLVIEFPNVPMSGRLVGFAGHTVSGSMYARAPVHLDVGLGREAVQRFTFELVEGWRPYALVTPEAGTATVSFAVSTSDAGTNHFCFIAEMRAPLRALDGSRERGGE